MRTNRQRWLDVFLLIGGPFLAVLLVAGLIAAVTSLPAPSVVVYGADGGVMR